MDNLVRNTNVPDDRLCTGAPITVAAAMFVVLSDGNRLGNTLYHLLDRQRVVS